MRTYKVTLADKEVILALNWAASQEIADKVADPLVIVEDTKLAEIAKSLARKPKDTFQWTGIAVADILYIGAKHSEEEVKPSREEMQEIVIDAGLDNAHAAALMYLGNMVNPEYDQMVAAAAKLQGSGAPAGE